MIKGLEWLREQFSNPKGGGGREIGLDYYWDEPDREIQKKAFISQLALAREVKRPVVIHSRDACLDTLDIMREEYGKGGTCGYSLFFLFQGGGQRLP